MYELPLALQSFSNYDQFILWRAVPDPDKPNEIIKKPVDYRTMYTHDAHDPTIWTDVHTASAVASGFPDVGVSFVLTDNDPFFCLDIDHAWNGSEWSPLAQQLCEQFKGAAVEVSYSGNGLHIFGKGVCPHHMCKNTSVGIELYTSKRSIALGRPETANGNASLDCSAALPTLVSQYFNPAENSTPSAWTTTPRADWSGYESDEELIARMTVKQTAFGEVQTDAGFLWHADQAFLSAKWPTEGRLYDASSADAALCSHLAFWTGCNCERMLALMKRSALVRDKWTKHRDYLKMTITSAAGFQADVCQLNPVVAPPESGVDMQDLNKLGMRTGYQYMPACEQEAYFKGSVYVVDQNRVLMPNGQKLKPDRFKSVMGGYDFQFDHGNEKTKRNAFEVFTESQAVKFPYADTVCFKPDYYPGEIIEREGLTCVNEYVDKRPARQKGCVVRFLDHIAKILPNERDQQIMLSYMAAMVQYKGVKFQWAPLLQGVQGNGKTLLTTCVEQAVGLSYSHLPNADNISNKFNSWMYGKILIGVEDIKVGENQFNVIERLKPMITGNRVAIEPKGVDQSTMEICCNFIFNSNHKDAIRKSKDDRRFCIFYTAQQAAEDIIRDGMGGEYFTSLYKWLKEEGYAYVTEFLCTYAILDELNPATSCQRAPQTSTTDQVLEQSLGSVEQEIMEAVESGRQRFCGDWISSFALADLLKELHIRMSHNKRGDMLEAMGYVRHPALKRGRATAVLSIDAGQPTLYVKKSNTLLMGLDGQEAMQHYLKAQEAAANPRALRTFGN